MEELMMVISNGMFVMGPKKAKAAALLKPRLLTYENGGKQVRLSPLPGIPGEVTYGFDVLSYAVPTREKTLYTLYAQVTAPEVDPNG